MSSQTATGPAARQRGLGYAFGGALALTLGAAVIGGILFAWLLIAARGPSAPQLLPADTQLYAATVPNVAGVVELEQLRDALRQGFGVADPAALLAPIERTLAVSLRSDVVTWLGSEVIVSVRGAEPASLQGDDPAKALLDGGELLFIIGSKNDPQAEAFLAKHVAARRESGATIEERVVDEVTIYVEQGAPPSPITAVALIDHYVVFGNNAAALEAMARADADGPSLAALPAFEAYQEQARIGESVAVYTDGTPGAELIRAAVRELLNDLAE